MEDKFVWKREYSLVLILNILYIMVFSYIMSSFT